MQRPHLPERERERDGKDGRKSEVEGEETVEGERPEINECSVYSQCSMQVCYLYFTQQKERATNRLCLYTLLSVVCLCFIPVCVCECV